MAINKKVTIIALCSVLLVVMVIGIVVTHISNKNDVNNARKGNVAQSMKAVKSICKTTYYKETCEKSLNSASNNTTDPKELIKVGFNVAVKHINETIAKSSTLQKASTDPRTVEAYKVCEKVLDLAIDDLKRSFKMINNFDFDIAKVDDHLFDLKVWLSGANTAQGTCLDAFEKTSGDAGAKMKKLLKTSRELTMNGFAMIDELSRVLSDLHISGSTNRKLLSEGMDIPSDGQYPSWVNDGERRLLRGNHAKNKPNVVVAQDGSGKYTTINEAIKDIPRESKTRFIIHIKAGVYKENVRIEKYMTNVVFIGDGPTKTKITGDRSDMKHFSTIQSATVGVLGFHFIAKDIGFENTAAADEGPAVALHSTSDKSIFYNCRIDGYQDTLYSHDHRQFFRDCTISGTIDFIFGDSIVVFQNCQIIARKPAAKQANMITAQGREFNDDITGIVIQNCNFIAEPELAADPKIKTYLGRPWKKYSKTIIMHSNIGSFITAEGWSIWEEQNPNNDTSWIAEYENTGPGADVANRVKWPSFKKITSVEAGSYTPANFLRGDEWIIPTGVPYTNGMTSFKSSRTNDMISYNNTNAISNNSANVMISNNTNTMISNNSANTMLSNNSANVMISNNSVDASISSHTADARLLSNNTDAMISSNNTDARISNNNINAMISNSTNTMISNNNADAMLSNNSADAMISNNSVDAMISNNSADARLSSNSVDARLSSNNVDPNISGNSVDVNISSDTADSRISSSAADARISSNNTDARISNNSTDVMISSNSTDAMISSNSTDARISNNNINAIISNSTNTMISNNSTNAMLSNNSTDAMIPNNSADAMISNNSVDVRISSNSVDARLSSNSVDPSISGNSVDASISSNTADARISSNTADVRISSNSTDAMISNNSTNTMISNGTSAIISPNTTTV